MDSGNRRILGILYVLLAGVGFGFLGIFAKLGFLRGLSVGEILTWRFCLATILLSLGLAFFNRKLLRVSQKQLLISASLGVFGYAIFSTFYFKAIQGISVAMAAMLLFTFPIFVTLGSWVFLKEKIQTKQIFSLGLSTLGLVCLLWGPLLIEQPLTILYGLSAALSYAIYVLVSGHFQKNIHPLTSSFYVILAASFTLMLFHRPDPLRWLDFRGEHFLIFLGLAIICTIGPLTLFLAGLQNMKSAEASVVVTIEPLTAALAGYFLLDEAFSVLQIVGGSLVILAILINASTSNRDSALPVKSDFP